jgi:hypothetical protein
MSSRTEKNELSSDGLRYTARQAGSPFAGSTGSTCTVKSCFFCGLHKPLSEGRSLKVLGKSTFVCLGCRPVRPAAQPAA